MKIDFDRVEYSKKLHPSEYRDPKKQRNCRQLTRNYKFYINDDEYTIKSDFWWNGASIPRAAWSIVGHPWADTVYFGALVHDMLYGVQLYNQRKCDEIFYEINRMSDMGWLQAQSMDKALMTCGWWAYSRTDEEIEGCAKYLLKNGEKFKC
jgi:hypothetical protein